MSGKKETIEAKARLSHPVILAGQPEQVYLRIDVVGAKQEQSRPPFDISVVLDRSGSMYGEKIVHARAAVGRLIDGLVGADHLALTAYDNVAETVFSRRKVDDALVMRARTEQVAPRGSTDISAGLTAGLQQLGSKGEALRRVFLLSDGLANQGITSPEGLRDLAQQGLAAGRLVSTFGVGWDFNEDLLRKIADAGGGNYYYIGSPEDIPVALEQELGELSSVVGQNLTVDFQAQHAQVVAVLGFDGNQLPAAAGDVQGGGTRSVILALAVPPSEEGEAMLGEVRCSWTPLGRALERVEGKITVSAVVSADAVRVQEARDEEVLRAARLQLAAAENREAARAAAQGDAASFHRSMVTASAHLAHLGADEDAAEQRDLLEEMQARGFEGTKNDRDMRLRTDESQYWMRKSRPSRWSKGDGPREKKGE